MAQIPIREYDAKRMFAEYSTLSYNGILVKSSTDMDAFVAGVHEYKSFVIKPDQLFGKRGKYGLLGVNLDFLGVYDWYKKYSGKEMLIGKQTGMLDTFLIEPFIPHTEEYYIAIQTERTHDILYFSSVGGINVEENWDSVRMLEVPLDSGMHFDVSSMRKKLDIHDQRVADFIMHLYGFFVTYGFAYLEINPFTFDASGNVTCLDMVARVDDSEVFKQRKHWKSLEFPHSFGPKKTQAEQYIEKLDSETGASLKFRLLHPDGNIWLLTSGGGASVIIADTLSTLGYASDIGNYGECSGNPDRENTREYTLTILDALLASKSTKRKYLIIAGAIANFTHIDKTFSGIIDALYLRREQLVTQDLHILVRRGGIHEREGLQMIESACQALSLRCDIADGNTYMTDILTKVDF